MLWGLSEVAQVSPRPAVLAALASGAWLLTDARACRFRGLCQGRAWCTCWRLGAGPPAPPCSAPPCGDWQLHDAPVHRPAVPCSPLPPAGRPPTHLCPALPLLLHAPTPALPVSPGHGPPTHSLPPPSHLAHFLHPPCTCARPHLFLPLLPPTHPSAPPSSPPPPSDVEPVLGTGVQWRRRGARPRGRGAGGSMDGGQAVPHR